MAAEYKTIKPLLLTGTNKSSRILSYLGLGIGVLLLLCSLQMFFNLQQLVTKTSVRKNGFDYISVTKEITNANMGKDNRFTQADLDDLKTQSFIEDAAPLTPNRFRVTASAGSGISFASEIFIEALHHDFIDTVPPGFTWKEGQETVPIIFSSDFLEMYNIFAPSYGLPQMSQATASNVILMLRCEGDLGTQTFKASIVAFSDRVSSLLAPKEFLDWANEKLQGDVAVNASRVFIKVKDASNEELIHYLSEKQYRVNKEKTILGRSKQVLQGVVSGIAIFGLLVVGLSLMLFSFYLQLMIAKSKDNLQLLLTLGYSPKWLSSQVAKQFIPVYITIVILALIATQLFQWFFHKSVMYNRPELSSYLHPIVVIMAVVLIILSIIANYRMVRKLLYKLF